ncbi:zf-HC2 domain-containing protein [Paenibacillus antibioticophila]|uniref:zf-HC2 domain-containing protein n=1 Tax=Paenibacillus antibioticophila TaxID=1274374 RepID=UPI0005C81E2F|nr:zf-HC2 domain-containing protein [Paenibacillus antibioticophila]
MKCSEAVEWMHRYIDHDLSEEESSALLEHIQNCRDCKEEFAMLKELSAQLEELPVLAPRYSLVDAILPQLEALDLGRREEGSASEEIPAATMAAEPVNRRRERTSGRSRAYRTGALGLAAAVILGVFIYQVEPRTVRDAEIASYSVMDTSENSSLESSAQDMGQSSDADHMTSGSAQEEAAQDASSATPEPEASDNNKPAADEQSTADSSPTADSGHSTGTAPEQPDSPVPNQKSPSSSSEQKPTSQENEKLANKEDTSAANRADASEDAVRDERPSDPPLIQENEGIAEQQGDLQDGGMMMGISRFAMPDEWTSPDGLFLVKYLDEHLYLYRNEFDSSTMVTDLPVEGDWVSGEWSEDGTVFTYIVEKDGVSASYTLQPVR